jgi:hypothetical protein
MPYGNGTIKQKSEKGKEGKKMFTRKHQKNKHYSFFFPLRYFLPPFSVPSESHVCRRFIFSFHMTETMTTTDGIKASNKQSDTKNTYRSADKAKAASAGIANDIKKRQN